MRQLIAEYKKLKTKVKKNPSQKNKFEEKIQEIEHRYYHETGSKLKE